MSRMRRSLVVALSAALTAGVGLMAAPASQGYWPEPGVIRVSIWPDGTGSGYLLLQADSTLKGFADSEELVFSLGWQDREIGIAMVDSADPSGEGRDILRAGNSLAAMYCDIARGLSTCRFPWSGPMPPTQVRVDFGSVTTNTTVVMAEGMAVPLAFNGGSGSDYVQGGAGDDWIRGNGGDDFLYGGPGDDYLDGGPGDDYIEGEAGRDDMRGGPGTDSIDAADNEADIRVDCGGPPRLLDFDKNLDKPTNCGADPQPIPPAPLETTLEPGEITVTIDGVPTAIKVAPNTGGEGVRIELGGALIQTGLMFDASGDLVFPNAQAFEAYLTDLWAKSTVEFYAWVGALRGETADASERRLARAKENPLAILRVDARGIAEGSVPLPAGQKPGDFTLQINAVTTSGAQLTVNVGVVLAQATPTPDPGPTETITIAKATRGKGKKAATVTVTGTTTGLAGTSVTPRYRVKGAKKWTLGTPVTVRANGSFTWRHPERREITVMMVSGAVRSKPVKVAAVKK